MAQGKHKLTKAKKSGGAQRRKVVRQVKLKRKGGDKSVMEKSSLGTTRAINKKNERLIAAKASSAGTSFFCNDLKEKGKSELSRQTATRNKKQNKSTKVSDRIQSQLSKLQGKK